MTLKSGHAMKRILVAVLTILTLSIAQIAAAQTTSWVQIEARPTLQEAQESARAYGADLPDVVGYRLNSGWYAIALGPYSPAGASARLNQLLVAGRIPPDSYLSDGGSFTSQFWPLGQTATPQAEPVAPALQPVETAQATLIDETPAQARRSEALLNRDQRIALQAALKWDGHYNSALDGAIGPGSRRAMAAYQAAINAEPTGILTTAQRTQLLSDYQDALDRIGMVPFQDAAAGIDIQMPMGLVQPDTPLAPFSRYVAKEDSGVSVMLLSQTGDTTALASLYELMQTLEVVPLSGKRERDRRSFVLTGQSDKIESYTFAATADGAIKGFTVTWRPEDRALMTRVTQMMRASFTTIPGVILSDTAGREEQSVDLFAGLEIRRPAVAVTGFFVDERGAVLTSAALGDCTRLTIGDDEEASVIARDDEMGLTLLRPNSALSPIGYAGFLKDSPRLQSEVIVAGYSYGGVLNLPALTYGQLSDLKGLQGEEGRARLSLSTLPGDTGGPVFDTSGAVIGMLLPRADGARQLPGEVNFAASVAPITAFLQSNGITPRQVASASPIAPEDLTVQAADMAVLVSCWN